MNDRKQNFHSVAWVMPQGWDFGVLGVQKFKRGIWDGAPLTAPSSYSCPHLFVVSQVQGQFLG